jgi:hypothetical protein
MRNKRLKCPLPWPNLHQLNPYRLLSWTLLWTLTLVIEVAAARRLWSMLTDWSLSSLLGRAREAKVPAPLGRRAGVRAWGQSKQQGRLASGSRRGTRRAWVEVARGQREQQGRMTRASSRSVRRAQAAGARRASSMCDFFSETWGCEILFVICRNASFNLNFYSIDPIKSLKNTGMTSESSCGVTIFFKKDNACKNLAIFWNLTNVCQIWSNVAKILL